MTIEAESTKGFCSYELEAVPACPACGNESGKIRYEGLQDRLEGVPGRWNLQECMACGCLFLDPRPMRDVIGRAYRSYYTHLSGAVSFADDNGNSLLWRLANDYMNARYGAHRFPVMKMGSVAISLAPPIRQQLDYFYRHLPRTPGRLLDVGCGNGVFLRRAKNAGWDVSGLEPDADAVRAAVEDGLDVYLGGLDDYRPNAPFDVATAAHVIEHVHDPKLFLQQIWGLLAKNGRIWLATPNVQSLGHKRFGRAWRGLEPPRHVVLFTAKALHALLTTTGFTNIRFLRRGRGARYIIHSSRELSVLEGLRKQRMSANWVDLRASISAAASEELVVIADKLC
ncbi:class I SAM-dependent methyltransferase [Dyella caseinilytica]|uniref:Class I SAM-dependent methyltransferase n=1 Tax=Dyella caseinilytica TaxID=1849581 RepID=A0ABX7GVF0_9GAMM|nr:class I SAM-dependent methyltransferase [Dyella caseinilytica]QRN54396.1 class I SAM-dependent methyltransferase [Dyella caseinilytica]